MNARLITDGNDQKEWRTHMAKNHYVTKPKRRNKNSNRKDPSHATMTALRKRAAADSKKSEK
jgi:hypothetical protein